MSHMTSCILRSVKNITVKSKDSLPFVSIIKIFVVQNEPLTNYSKTVLDRKKKLQENAIAKSREIEIKFL